MLKTLFVMDNPATTTLDAISFETYLNDYPKKGEPKTRVINLCDTRRYLGQGYYCSLLAEARRHQAMPDISTINAMRDGTACIWLDQATLTKLEIAVDDQSEHLVCMGECAQPAYSKLATRAFSEYPCPVFEMQLIPENTGILLKLKLSVLDELGDEQKQFCMDILDHYHNTVWRKKGIDKKHHRWDMALLVDPEEKVPPSDKGAINRFIKAGEKLGIRVHKVSASELHNLNLYDALFIRETTAIDHHTSRLAQRAEELGLVVMDDPKSILRCCNKVFLHDAFNYKGVPSLKTQFVRDASDATLTQIEQDFGFPVVLKMPEGSFSRGVYKAKTREELHTILTDLLQSTAIVLAQEYMFTDYDWRIGVLGGRALYACRYFMARGHWQIYNHNSSRAFSGGFDTLPTFEVPKQVLNAALKAAALVGNGLYGIDIKELDGKAYVLEVNDNPSIDHGVEDLYLGEELYMQVMSEFLRRLEARGR